MDAAAFECGRDMWAFDRQLKESRRYAHRLCMLPSAYKAFFPHYLFSFRWDRRVVCMRTEGGSRGFCQSTFTVFFGTSRFVVNPLSLPSVNLNCSFLV